MATKREHRLANKMIAEMQKAGLTCDQMLVVIEWQGKSTTN